MKKLPTTTKIAAILFLICLAVLMFIPEPSNAQDTSMRKAINDLTDIFYKKGEGIENLMCNERGHIETKLHKSINKNIRKEVIDLDNYTIINSYDSIVFRYKCLRCDEIITLPTSSDTISFHTLEIPHDELRWKPIFDTDTIITDGDFLPEHDESYSIYGSPGTGYTYYVVNNPEYDLSPIPGRGYNTILEKSLIRTETFITLEDLIEYEIVCYNDSTKYHSYKTPTGAFIGYDSCYEQTGNLVIGYGIRLICKDEEHFSYRHKKSPFKGFTTWFKNK